MRICIGNILCAFLLVGCAVQQPDIGSRPQTGLIGMSKKDLLQCAGTPARQERLGELEFLAFTNDRDGTVGAAGKTANRYCEAAFVLRNGIVQTANYRGHTGGLLPKGEQCAFIVENCLK